MASDNLVGLSEQELEAKFGEAFDQPKDFEDDDPYLDDDDWNMPYRYIRQWSLWKDGLPVSLPTTTNELKDYTLKGWLEAAESVDDEAAEASAEHVFVKLDNLASYCIDRSQVTRGFWVMTVDAPVGDTDSAEEEEEEEERQPSVHAVYWLHEPEDPGLHLSSRAQLGLLSNLVDLVFSLEYDKDARKFAKMTVSAVYKEFKAHQGEPPFDIKLLAKYCQAVASHLVSCHDAVKDNCAFLKSLRTLQSSKEWSTDQILQSCVAAEKRSSQRPWGQPLANGVATLSRQLEAAEEEEGKKREEAFIHDSKLEELEAPPAKKKKTESKASKKKRATSKSRRTSSPKRARRQQEQEEEETSPVASSGDGTAETSPTTIDSNEGVELENPPPGGRRPRRAKKVQSYYVGDDDDEMDDEFSDDASAEKTKQKKATKKKPARRKKVDSDDDSASFVEDKSDSEMEFDSDASSTGPSLDGEEEEEQPRKKKGTKATTSKSKSKPGKKKMCDMFSPINTPIYKDQSLEEIYKEKEFLDSCGMDATDDIIDGLVGEQVDKIGSLLQRSLQNSEIGSSKVPLQLGTACSGTDAPALALTLVQEQMELRGLGDLFNFSHEFSCENDPCKQAYLARNFDSILYPDIAKLTDEPPRDVYGQERTIPPFNLFVAGTSCKNFSMLRSNRRIDIEDKGCSGETFLAATEVLFKEKPAMAIFENVIGAPWLKMQEYITGRVKLSDCDSSKAISNANKDKNMELTFVLDKEKRIVVDRVPSVYGVRCGAVVSGFVRPGSNKLNCVKWPPGTKKSCSLSQLIKANKISKQADTLVFETECTYCTHLAKVDTKKYGLPQTRQRTYMMVWRPDNDDINDDLGEYWEQLVRHLESPVRHSLQSFILQVDHDIIRVFREALKGPPGRQTMRGVFLEPDFWSSANANLPHNKVAREKLGLKDDARFITCWSGHGKKQVPPHYWLEYMKCNYQREMDLIDILHASGMRDPEAHDSNFSSYYWNVSQNASKEKHRSACPGIAGCITPGGDFLLPREGRPILGCEKLMIQGIPYFRLALGNETEVQLGDLAGNAMSLTVVCATMLAAMTCKQLRTETIASRHGDAQKLLSNEAPISTHRKTSNWKEMKACVNVDETPSTICSSASSFFLELAALSPAAVNSSIWCTCETSGSNSITTHFLECTVCRVSCCRNCICANAGYNLDSHETVDVDISEEDHSLGSFLEKLRRIVPSTLIFNKEGIEEISTISGGEDEHRVAVLSSCKFHLHRIKRDRKKWQIIYYARDNNGIGEAVAEFKVIVGELKREEISVSDKGVEIGVKGELTSFFPARTAPLVYGPLERCAVVTALHGHHSVEWKGKGSCMNSSIHVEGEGTTESARVQVGLTDAADEAIKQACRKNSNAKSFRKAKDNGETRRWLYPKNWKKWPESICIKDSDNSSQSQATTEAVEAISGTYNRAHCLQTTNQSALWIRKATEDSPSSSYISIKPNVNRTGPDKAVVTSSISHDDSSSILAVFPWDWQPCDALAPERHHVDNVELKSWVPLKCVECLIPHSNIKVESPTDSADVLISVCGLNETDTNMLCRRHDSGRDEFKLDVVSGQKAQQTIRAFNSICVAPILQFAAGEGLKYDLKPCAPWTRITPSNPSVPFGHCRKTIPPRPTESWVFDEERAAWGRRSEPGASRKFYLALQAAPRAFELWMNKHAGTLSVKVFPEVSGHHAAFQLIEGRKLDDVHNVDVSFRLSDVSQQSDPTVSPFKISNCDSEEPTSVLLKSPHKLYERQKKVVTKMRAIETLNTEFEELEMSEQEMPGSTGLSLIAKAIRKRNICGGVICDAIGSGKTVISIAMILKGLEAARRLRENPERSENQTGATLVVVPKALIDQWKSECEKFTTSLKTIQVYDNEVLSKITVEDIVEADVVICPIDILEAKGYMERLLKAAKVEIDDVPKLPDYTGQIEQTQARGTWIPATSADPYGGGNNPNNQKRRNQSAYYTYIYLTAVEKLRDKTFHPSDSAPLEYFEWERVIVDEIHESLCTTRGELKLSEEQHKAANNGDKTGFFKEKNRRAGRELLGITQKNTRLRPLVFRKGIFGLTGTPLLDSSSRVTELANLMGNTYIVGLSSHWRKLERESSRDIFLHNYLEPKQSREIRKNIYAKCQEYVRVACCRNKTGEEMEGIELVEHLRTINMTEAEKSLYLKSQSGIIASKQSFAITPEDFDVSAGHDISKFLRQNAGLESRGKELVRICREILGTRGNEHTKIIVFTDGRIGAGNAAREFLESSGLGCTCLEQDDSVEMQNKKISWYQTGDATSEDRKRPRVLVLHFEHAAGLNLQTECHNLILFTPLYVGEGGSSSDPVSDASTELQAIGRVYRAGQTNPKVNVYRIEIRGPNGEECLDGQLIRRNTDADTVAMAVNAGE